MLENILFGILCALVVGAAIFAWWFERPNSAADKKKEEERK